MGMEKEIVNSNASMECPYSEIDAMDVENFIEVDFYSVGVCK